MQWKLAIFDIAGTTVKDDNAVARSFHDAFGDYGLDISGMDVAPLMGYKKTVAVAMVLEKIGRGNDAHLATEIHQAFVRRMEDFYRSATPLVPTSSAEEVMGELKERGLRIALNTGFPRSIADVIVNRLGWIERGIVDDYIASDEVESGRPDPAMIHELMKRAGVDDPRQVMKIGDTEVDVNEGKNAGCSLNVAVTTGAFSRSELAKHSPDYIIDDLSELPILINSFA